MSYLIDKFKGQYRLMVEYDKNTNQFNRKANGTFEDIDVYIDCANNIRIFYFGDGQLEAYIPSLGRGRNVIKNIYSDFVKDIESSKYITVKEVSGKKITMYDYESLYNDKDLNDIITDISETDEEIMFKFYWDKMETFSKYFKPKTSAADRSPFSTKNLPKSDYKIPDDDLVGYKNATKHISKENMFVIKKIQDDFLRTISNKQKSYEDIKADMKQQGLKTKEYLHSIGKFDEYVQFIEESLCQI